MPEPRPTKTQGQRLNALHHDHVVAAANEARYEEEMAWLHKGSDGWRGTPEHWKTLDKRSNARDAFYKYVDELASTEARI